MSYTTFYLTGPNHQETHTFGTAEKADAWDAMVSALKAESKAVFDRRREIWSITEEVHALYQQWMSNAKAFCDRFDEDHVSADIKWALNSAKEGLEVEVTQWTNPPDKSLFEYSISKLVLFYSNFLKSILEKSIAQATALAQWL